MCRLMTPQLAEVLKDFPLYSQDGKGREAVCRAIFALGSIRWYILEGETDGNDTISLNELSDVELDYTKQGIGKLQVRQQKNFRPTKLSKLKDDRLQRFLARFE